MSKFAIRKSGDGCSSYVVFRKRQIGTGVSGNFRLAKTSERNAQVFSNLHDVQTIVRGLKSRDITPGTYTIYPV